MAGEWQLLSISSKVMSSLGMCTYWKRYLSYFAQAAVFNRLGKLCTKQCEAFNRQRSRDRTCLGRLWCIDRLTRKASLRNEPSHPKVGCSCCVSSLQQCLIPVCWKRRHDRMVYCSVQIIQLSLLAGLDLLQLLRKPFVSILEGVLGVVVDDGAVGCLDTGVDLKR